MKFQQLTIICITIALLAAVTLADKEKGKGKGKGKWGGWGGKKNMTCKGEPIESKDLWKGMKECHAEFMPATTEEPLPEDEDKKKEVLKERMKKWKNNFCVEVCQNKKKGVLNDDGTLNESGAETYVKSVFPEKAQADMIAAMKTCYTDSFTSTTPSMDNNCESYKEFNKCSKKAFFKVCEIKWGKWKKGGKKDDEAAAPEGEAEAAAPEGEAEAVEEEAESASAE